MSETEATDQPQSETAQAVSSTALFDVVKTSIEVGEHKSYRSLLECCLGRMIGDRAVILALIDHIEGDYEIENLSEYKQFYGWSEEFTDSSNTELTCGGNSTKDNVNGN
ncbi:MAG: hypothetical protein AAF571_03445 [Verrucomicrobiota bacterium]